MLIILSTLLYGALHSFLASLEVKALVQRRLGSFGLRFYRLFFNLFGLATLVPILILPVWLPDRTLYTIPFPWIGLTILIQALALLGLLAGLLQTDAFFFIGLRQVFQPPDSLTQEGGELVTRGLYRWMRHPLYTTGLIALWLSPVMTQNLLILYLCLTLYVIVGAVLEERKLVRRFGQAYLDYRRGVPMFIPVLGLLLQK